MKSRRTVQLFCVLALFGLGSGCAETTSFWKPTPRFYSTAEQNYLYGLKALKNENWATAVSFFQHVKDTFGFSKWAALSELGIADADLGSEKYTQAIDEYRQFIKAHPSNERVRDGYAALKVAECYYKQIPSDFFVLPPSYQKDQGPVMDAERELSAYLEQYPTGPYLAYARKLHADVVRRIADHELYVAGFYLHIHHPYAAIGRLEGLVHDYPGAKREAETLLLLGKTYLEMHKPGEARAAFEKLATLHPDDYRAVKARLYIDFIDKRYGNIKDKG